MTLTDLQVSGNVLDAVAKAGAVTGGGVTKKMSADFLNAWGILPGQVKLADLRDKTVVIAFFYKAKTKG